MILCCGEALIDMIPSEPSGSFLPIAGGAVFNTAIGLGRQGVDVGMLSGVSNDLFGTQLFDVLQESHVSTDYLIRSERPTTLAFVKLVNGKASYAFYDENTAGQLLGPADLPQELPAGVSTLFFGGISLVAEPCADTYAEFLYRHSKDCLVMVDPNIRPSFIVDEARYRERLDGILAHADIVKISDDDLAWLIEEGNSNEDKVNRLIERGVSYVCLTLDAKGAQVFDQSGMVASAQPPVTKVIDTVGAGDAFNAGFMTSLERQGCLSKSTLKSMTAGTLQTALEFATSFASDTVTRPGSDPAWNFQAVIGQ